MKKITFVKISINLMRKIFLFNFNFNFWLHCAACGILVPQPGIEPVPPALEVQSLNYRSAKEVPSLLFLYSVLGIPYTSFKKYSSPSLSSTFWVDWGDFWFVFLIDFLKRFSTLLLFSHLGTVPSLLLR